MALENKVRTANLSGQSKVGDTVVAYLGASIQGNNSVSVNVTVNDVSAYRANKAAVDADTLAFQADVIAIAEENVTNAE